jgi:cytochrome c biogenesis protein CcmG, thiol:disulfide interchange protein DsbE
MQMNKLTNRKFIWFSAGLLLILAAWTGMTAWLSGDTTQGRIPAPQTGFTAPEFSLADAQNTPVRLADLRGKAILINLWASWCPPCQAEMPAIQRVYQDFKDKGLVVLGVNITAQDDPAKAGQFVHDHGLTFNILFDYKGEVAKLYQMRALPTTIFVGRDGVIRDIVVGGPLSEASLRTRIESMLDVVP